MSNPKGKRKLAAIFFADIAGYTALMQSNEKLAMQLLKHYQSTLQKYVSKYDGEITKNYGDGSMCLFGSVLNAAHCAIDLQRIFQKEPVIPLRIGIHVGDVMFLENDIYGDSINIAARIESMAVPGAILMSKATQQKLKSQADIQFSSVGTYVFKNVEEPIEIFAFANEGLVIPDKKQIKGTFKGKAVNESLWQKIVKSKLSYVLLAFFVALLSFKLLGFDFPWENKQSQFLSSATDDKRIAVYGFENNTGNDELDIFGKMLEDRIAHAISRNNLASVISSQVIDNYYEMASAENGSADFNVVLEQNLAVDSLITGSYYLNKDSILIDCSMVDAKSGSLAASLETITSHKDEPLEAIKQLSERVLSFLATADLPELIIEEELPKYEALKHILESKMGPESEELFHIESALKIDPNYFEAKLLRLSYYYNMDDYHTMDSLRNQINLEKLRPSQRQQNLLYFYDALLDGNNLEAYNRYKEEYDFAPYDPTSNLTMMVMALQFVHDAEEVLEIYEEVKEPDLALAKCFDCQIRQYVKGLALIELERYKEAQKEFLNLYELAYDRAYLTHLLRTFVKEKSWSKVEEYMSAAQIPKEDLAYLYFTIANESLLISEKTKAHQFYKKSVEFFELSDFSDLEKSMAYYYLDDFKESKKLLDKLLLSEPQNTEALTYKALNCLSLNLNDCFESSKSTILNSKESFDFGATEYAMAKLFLAEGKKDDCLLYLQKAIENGQIYKTGSFCNDAFFASLQDDSRFIKLHNYWK